MTKKQALEVIAKTLAEFTGEDQPAAWLVRNRLDSLGHHIEDHWREEPKAGAVKPPTAKA